MKQLNPSIPPTKEPKWKVPQATSTGGLSPFWVIVLIFLFVLIIFGYRIVAAAGVNFFVWADHILGADTGNTPLAVWALFGLGFGAVIGSVVFWRKFQAKFKWCLKTIIPFFLIVIVLHAWSDPMQGVEPRPLAVAVDSTDRAVVEPDPPTKQREQRKTTRPDQQVANEQKPAASTACEQQQASIAIQARSDSVTIHFRTTDYQKGPWTDWRSILIPQQGQFMLSDGGSITANSVQYYYEIGAVFTRSAQNPFTRSLCDGELLIDTY